MERRTKQDDLLVQNENWITYRERFMNIKIFQGDVKNVEMDYCLWFESLKPYISSVVQSQCRETGITLTILYQVKK